jgi:mannosyltransferase OCH1-like enzyme
MPIREQAFCTKIREMHPDYEYRLWTDKDVDMFPNVVERYDAFYEKEQYAFCADILRIWVVYKYGGFYLDVDFEMLKPFDDFLQYDALFLYHQDTQYGESPNGIFGAAPKNPALEGGLKQVALWNHWFGPSWVGTITKEHFGLDFHVDHATLHSTFRANNYAVYMWEDFHATYAKHYALYSWSSDYKVEE